MPKIPRKWQPRVGCILATLLMKRLDYSWKRWSAGGRKNWLAEVIQSAERGCVRPVEGQFLEAWPRLCAPIAGSVYVQPVAPRFLTTPSSALNVKKYSVPNVA